MHFCNCPLCYFLAWEQLKSNVMLCIYKTVNTGLYSLMAYNWICSSDMELIQFSVFYLLKLNRVQNHEIHFPSMLTNFCPLLTSFSTSSIKNPPKCVNLNCWRLEEYCCKMNSYALLLHVLIITNNFIYDKIMKT